MFRRNAVLLTVLFAMVITLISISYTFWQMSGLNALKHTENLFSKYSVITQVFREHMQKQNTLPLLEANLAVYDLVIQHDKRLSKRILEEAHVLKREGFRAVNEALFFNRMHIYRQKFIQDMRATMLEHNNRIYFFIESPRDALLLLDSSAKPYSPWRLIYAYVTVTGMIIIAFLLILLRLAPLRRLRRKIAQFGTGDMSVSFKAHGEDEISLISNELDHTREKIEALIESRTLFLRNIMHELKTPIAKGRIVTQMLESEKHRQRYDAVFERLESLIGQFALIEEVRAGYEHLSKKEFRLIDLIDGAIDMAMVESDHVEVDVDAQFKLMANYRLFSTAIKNMIDNAIKYSPEHKVRISVDKKEICFESRGEALKHPLAYYVEPFTKEQPAKNSFGLGLYLVDAILKAHAMVLAYEYEAGINRFIFVPEKKK